MKFKWFLSIDVLSAVINAGVVMLCTVGIAINMKCMNPGRQGGGKSEKSMEAPRIHETAGDQWLFVL